MYDSDVCLRVMFNTLFLVLHLNASHPGVSAHLVFVVLLPT